MKIFVIFFLDTNPFFWLDAQKNNNQIKEYELRVLKTIWQISVQKSLNNLDTPRPHGEKCATSE